MDFRFARAGLAALLLCPVGAVAASSDDRRYFYEDIFTPFFVLDARAGRYKTARPGADDKAGFFERKPAGGVRVFVLGGSIAARFMAGPHPLGESLKEVLPSREVEAVPAGMAGYDSAREALVLEEVLEREPDAVVLLSCHNEALGSPPVPLWILHAGDRLARLKSFAALVAALRPGGGGVPPDARLAAERREAAFESNLRAMMRRAREKGTAFVVAAPPLNYRAPSDLKPPTTNSLFWKGWLERLRGRDAVAVADWSALLDTIPSGAVDAGRAPLLGLMGASAARAGDPRASEFLVRGMEEDWYAPGRCSLRSERAILKVAAEEGAVAVDLDGDFRRRAAPGVPGMDMFDDTVHWLRRDDPAVAAALVDALRSAPRLAGLPWDAAGLKKMREGADRAAAGPIDESDTLNTLRYAFSGLRARIAVTPTLHPERFLSWRSAAYLEAVYDRRPEWFNDAPGLLRRAARGTAVAGRAWGQGTLKADPGQVEWYRGETLLRRGDAPGALRALDAALREDRNLEGARLDRALALELLGDRAGAREALDPAAFTEAKAEAEALWRALKGAPAQ